jgi:hypothetical protein
MTAAGAESIEFEAVGLDGKAVSGGDLLLQFFNLAVFEFDDFAATCADEVIVMPFMGNVIVLRL